MLEALNCKSMVLKVQPIDATVTPVKLFRGLLLCLLLTVSFSATATTWYVSPTGNNSNIGSDSSAPFLTIQKAASVVNPGDTVLVSPGNYGEYVDLTRPASQANRITFRAQGSVYSGGFNVRLPYYTIDGFDLNGTNTSGANGIVYLYQPANETWVLNCTLHNVTNKSGIWMVSPSGTNSTAPSNGQLNCVVSNCTFYGIYSPNIVLMGSNHIIAANKCLGTGGEGDFIRPFGANHHIYGNYITNLATHGMGGHPDIMQVYGDYGWWCKDVVFEKNQIYGKAGDDAQICQLEMNSGGNPNNPLGTYGYSGSAGHMTNLVFRNNLFVNIQYLANIDMDGTKWYNNLFYRCGQASDGAIFALGGNKGSGYGTEFRNNVFYQCATNWGTNPGGGWYQQDMAWETNVTITADYDFICGINYNPKNVAPPNDSTHWRSDGQEAHGINGGNPLFVDENDYNFQPAAGSPLIGAGNPVQTFSDDFTGTSRSGSWSIGPFQQSGGTQVTNNPPPTTGATYYVSMSGNDSNSGSQAQPWRTIQNAINAMVAGDTLLVSPGNYNEYLHSKAAGLPGAPITFRANPPNDPNNQVVVAQFRIQHPYQVIEGFNITGASDINNAAIRLEYNPPSVNGSVCVITNNTIRDGVFLITTNASFGSNYIQITDGNFNTVGFTNGSLVFLGSDSRYWHTNHDTKHTVLSNSADGLRMYFTDTLLPDSGTHYWVPVYAGQDNSSYKGIQFVIGPGTSGVTNCTVVGNTFSNLFGPNLNVTGDNHLIVNNKFVAMHGWYAMQLQGRNHIARNNLLIDSPNIIWFTPDEMASIVHPPGGNWFDYQENVMASWYADSTNILFEHNWLQHCDNQLTQIEQNSNAVGFVIRSNVFVGMQAQGSFSRSGLTFDHNTFYRDSSDLGRAHALGIGGTDGVVETNVVLSSNAFVDIGSHQSTNSEGFFTIISATNYTITGNFVAGPETTGWQAKALATNYPGIAVNGGDPLFVNPSNPLGPDGIPFTDDDGLRPLPQSPLAVKGIGALTPVKVTAGVPIAHFTVTAPLGWFDLTGTNFDLGWVALKPHERRGVIRPYNTPEVLGVAPVNVTFSASNSISGVTAQSTNNVGITGYSWSFGDGSSTGSTSPFATHNFLSAGTWPVTLTVTNSSGGTASYTQTYRTIGSTNPVIRPAPPTILRFP